MHGTEWQVLTNDGLRKYVTDGELARFLAAARSLPAEGFALCALLAHTGCRISEALALSRERVGDGTVTLRTLKRRRIVFRMLPVPPWIVCLLLALPSPSDAPDRLWTVHRTTGYRWIKRAMTIAGITGPQACPKGLRHGFGIRAVTRLVPPNLIQRWLGHASIETTSIYLNALGQEERLFAARMW